MLTAESTALPAAATFVAVPFTSTLYTSPASVTDVWLMHDVRDRVSAKTVEITRIKDKIRFILNSP